MHPTRPGGPLHVVRVRDILEGRDFVETVARNAGLRVTIFRDRARAEQHLRADG